MKQIDDMFRFDVDKTEQPVEEEVKAESYALPAKFITKDDTADQEVALKMQVLVDRLKEYKDKIISLRDQNLEAAKTNIEKSRELERVKIEKEALEKQISELNFIQDRRAGGGGVIRLRGNAAGEEMLRRKQEMQQELMMGINLVGGEVADLVGRQVVQKNFFQKFLESLWNFLSKFIVLKSDIKTIEFRYDKSISAYFGFYKFVVNLSILILGIYSYQLVSHILSYNESLIETCQGTLCFTLYYSFTTDEDFVYSITFMSMIAAVVFMSISKWVRTDKIWRKTAIYGGSEVKLKKFSAIIFNSWPWSISTEADSADQSVNVSNMIHTAIKDFARQREAANRTAKQKTALLVKRIIGTTIYIIILSAGWVIIIALIIQEKSIASSFENSSQGLSLFMRFLPKICISFVNAMFPAMTLKITALESWDNPSFIIQIQIIRMYVAKVLNVILYAVLNLQLATQNIWFSNDVEISFESEDYYCREDQVGVNLAILVISEAITSKVIPLMMAFVYWILAKCKKGLTWKKEIKVSQQVINLIYFQGLLWITFPYFPYIMILAPFFLYIDFKFQFWKLRALQTKPLEQTQSFEIMIFIMRLLNATLVLILVYYGYFLTVSMKHSTYKLGSEDDILCGPFENLESVNTVVITKIKETIVLSQIWDYILNYSPVFWVVLLLCLTKILFSKNHISLLEEYLKEREFETDHQIEELQKRNEKLMKREKYKGKV